MKNGSAHHPSRRRGSVLDIVKFLLILPPILIGVNYLKSAASSRQAPVREEQGEIPRRVRAIDVPAVDLIPRAIGYGVVEPASSWEGVAQVKGRVVETWERLEEGEIVPAGTLLVKIDPTRYQLTVERAEADIAGIQAKMQKIGTTRENQAAMLSIEERSLTVARSDLERLQRLFEKRATSQDNVEKQEREVLTQEGRIQSVRNELNLLPAELAVLEADLMDAKVRLADAKEDLKWTLVTAPFHGRITSVDVENTQFVQPGQTLVSMDGIAVAEIPVQITFARLRPILPPGFKAALDPGDDPARLWESMKIEATVRLRSGSGVIEWEAEFARPRAKVDSRSRSASVVVRVIDPYRKAKAGEAPPLVRGMFCEVELRGQAKPGAVVIPRTSLHGNEVFLVGGDKRLEKRQVSVHLMQGSLVLIDGGLTGGERLVVSDLRPAVVGMLLETTTDLDLARSVVDEATGEGPLR